LTGGQKINILEIRRKSWEFVKVISMNGEEREGSFGAISVNGKSAKRLQGRFGEREEREG
jgi:hypothetical protein